MEWQEGHGTDTGASETHSRAAVLALIYRVPGTRDPGQSTDSRADTSPFCAATHLSASSRPVTQVYGSVLNLDHPSPPKGVIFAEPLPDSPVHPRGRSCAAPRSLAPAPSSIDTGREDGSSLQSTASHSSRPRPEKSAKRTASACA